MAIALRLAELLRQMVDRGASDLHLKVGSYPGFRIDGELVPLTAFGIMTQEQCHSFAASVVPDELREAFEATEDVDFSFEVQGGSRLRTSVFTSRGKTGLVLRLIPGSIPDVDDLGLPEICRKLVRKPRGLVLVTGPTGSGKSTSLAALIHEINQEYPGHILTLEDPVEFLHENRKAYVTQREIGRDTPNYGAALRRAFRQDPDIILVGELRDLDTIAMTLSAAETGHLVLGTLHTTGAAQSIDRIIDVFPHEAQPQIRLQLATTLQGVIAQCLLPRIGGGRVAAHEVMTGSSAVRACIREGKTHQLVNLIQTGASKGMQTLEYSLASLVKKRLITQDNASSRANDAEELLKQLGLSAPEKPIKIEASTLTGTIAPTVPKRSKDAPAKPTPLIDKFK